MEGSLVGQKGWEACWALMGKNSVLRKDVSLGVTPPGCQNKRRVSMSGGQVGGEEMQKSVGWE